MGPIITYVNLVKLRHHICKFGITNRTPHNLIEPHPRERKKKECFFTYEALKFAAWNVSELEKLYGQTYGAGQILFGSCFLILHQS